MMNIVLLGGNGYIGRHLTEMWIHKNNDIKIYTISRSGKNKFEHPNVINIKADVNDFEKLKKLLPQEVDFIINLIGAPEKDELKSREINDQPAEVMLKIAQIKKVKAMGMIGGKLGPKYFLNTKAKLINMLRESEIPVVVVEPTLVYGGDRRDRLSKLVPLFNILGVFSKNIKPIRVEKVVKEMIEGLENK